MSAKLALEKYSRRHAGVRKKRAKKEKRETPEKKVEREVLIWAEARGFDISVVESKAVYSAAAGRYLRGQAAPGFSDLAGVTPLGIGCFVELKAKGRVNTIRPSQIDFLLRKIRKGAFAACVDSASTLSNIYDQWLSYIVSGKIEEAKKFLITSLPKYKEIDFDGDNELPW
jgi:hypothetical protein